ncbi:MAG: hypothetical protein KAU95_02025 [Candidatus Aenigmarchaeota archaeon]|nr:hypothetical protein [Candidatus Aenigmarchaeota archaeon]
MKKLMIAILLILILSTAQSAITNLKVPFEPRLGEKLTITGNAGTADILCKFLILDSNGTTVERLSDEYTFADGTFYSERTLAEPPYYRGDDFNANVTCGLNLAFQTFNVQQPLSLAHPIQKGIENITDEANLEPLMMGVGVLGAVLISLLSIAFFFKVGKSYAG